MQIGEFSVEVIKKDIKNIHLSIHPPEGRVRVAVPTITGDSAIRLLIVKKLPWIKRQISSFEKQERQSAPQYVSGESHFFRGNRYRLNISYHSESPKVCLKSKTRIEMFLREESSVSQKDKLFTNWMRKDLRERIEPVIRFWEDKLEVQAQDWTIRKMKTKWGSCNTEQRRILFNLELAKKNDKCLEYVVLHELVHLLERKHNDRFIAHLDRLMPKWRSYRAELNKSLGVYEVDQCIKRRSPRHPRL